MSGSRRIDVKRALHTYVLGRDIGYGPTAKAELAESDLRREGNPGSEGTAGDSTEGSEDGATAAPSPGPEGGRFGVPVPDELAFHRSAGRWRERIAGLRKGGA